MDSSLCRDIRTFCRSYCVPLPASSSCMNQMRIGHLCETWSFYHETHRLQTSLPFLQHALTMTFKSDAVVSTLRLKIAMFSGRHTVCQESTKGYVFIDRDGKHFRHMLNWLRDGVVPSMTESDYSELLREAEYFQFLGLMDGIKSSVVKRKEEDEMGTKLTNIDIIKCIQSEKVRLRGVNLSGLDLSKLGAKLTNANLKGANLQRAYLQHVNLRDTDLEGAKLELIRCN